jgi:hypothetical protein
MHELLLNKHINRLPRLPHKNLILTQKSTHLLKRVKGVLVDTMLNMDSTITPSISIMTHDNIPKGDHFDSIPADIITIIENGCSDSGNNGVSFAKYEWSFIVNEINYNISLTIVYSSGNNSGNNGGNEFKYVSHKRLKEHYIFVRTIIEFLAKNSSGGDLKTRNIGIYIYLTKHIKVKPKSKKQVLSWININTGLTTFCNKETEINVFRAEEWCKVFIHECIHNLCMDFSSSGDNSYRDRLKGIFIIDSDYLLFETYTELWAEIIQILFIDILNGYGNKEVSDNVASKITDEFVFSVFQTNKVFSSCTNGVGTYNDLVNKNIDVLKQYREESNCFAYYILKMVALYNINEFLSWCIDHNGSDGKNGAIQFNKSSHNINSFIDFFEERYTNVALVKYINTIINTTTEVPDTFLHETLRISICEIIV